MNSYTEKINKSEFERVKTFFVNKNAEFSSQQYMVFRAKLPNVVACLYESGKLLFQGSDVEPLVNEFRAYFGANVQQGTLLKPQNQTNQNCDFSQKPHIGVDESGKGDFFGPLVVAGVLTDESNMQKFIDAGVKDSKKLSDEKILQLANIIKANAEHSVVVISNEKYNDLYKKFNNLNKLLAWGHARVIENILEKQPCDYALSDQFGNEALIKNALMEKGKAITLDQRFRGEEDIAVASASVLARAEYVKRMDSLSKRYEIQLYKGANDKVVEAAKKFQELYGKDRLKEVAKLHFKTFNQI